MWHTIITARGYLKMRIVANVGKVLFSVVCSLALLFIAPPRSVVRSQTLQEEARDKQFASLFAKAESDGQVRVIVKLRGANKLSMEEVDEQVVGLQQQVIADAQEIMLQSLAGTPLDSVKKFKYIPFMAMTVNMEGLKSLQLSGYAEDIQESKLLRPELKGSTSLIAADKAWAKGFSGSGQTVAILDSGVDKTHPFLANKVVSEACYSTSMIALQPTNPMTQMALGNSSLCPPLEPGQPPLSVSTAPGSGVNCDPNIDECNHGTSVAGVAAGRGDDFSGVAKDSTIISIQVFHKDSTGISVWADDLTSGLERVFELRGSYKIAAANVSIGFKSLLFPTYCDTEDKSLKDAIDLLRSAGIATVVSSGNGSNSSNVYFPACISTAISVGAVDDGSDGTTADVVSDFSNSYPYLNLLAPGRWIYTSIPGGGYENYWGTSHAAPHVAGAWAVLKSVSPQATVDEVLNALVSTGKPITDSRNGITKPRIQLDAAVDFIQTGNAWDFIIQDNRSGDYLLINTLTRQYQYTRCGQAGFTMTGRGEISRIGCLIRLTDGPRVTAVIDRCLIGPRNTGQAIIKTTPLGPTYFINDSNILNNSPFCPAVPN